MKRQGISKSVRFAVFLRDSFTCRYCGRQSDVVKLVLDHAIPVCQGGSSEPENLITACEDCNSGKGGKTIGQFAPNETDRLKALQEHREQLEIAKAAHESAKARQAFKQEVCNYYCEARRIESMSRKTLNVLCSYAERHGVEVVFGWIDIAAESLPSHSNDQRVGRYISGIRRKQIQENICPKDS